MYKSAFAKRNATNTVKQTHRHVDVFCRYRPIESNKPSIKSSEHHLFELKRGQIITVGHGFCEHKKFREREFKTDLVFTDQATQQEVYRVVGEPVVRDVVQGFNGCILCYGQTGSGKTYSLFGDMTNAESPVRGMAPRCIEQLFDDLSTASDLEEVVMKCSMIDIYNNEMTDLLMPNQSTLKIRVTIDQSVFVEGVHEEYVDSIDDVFDVLQIGFRNRMLMNHSASRSHCILTVRLKQVFQGGETKMCRFHFVDLAGSEKVRKRRDTGEPEMLSPGKINLSLVALGRVVRALGEGRKVNTPYAHAPYSSSNLTHLLKDALGGNSKSVMLLTFSLATFDYRETVRTLMFAERLKLVRNHFKINKEMSNKELLILLELYKQKLGNANGHVMRLRKLIESIRAKGDISGEMYHRIDRTMTLLKLELEMVTDRHEVKELKPAIPRPPPPPPPPLRNGGNVERVNEDQGPPSMSKLSVPRMSEETETNNYGRDSGDLPRESVSLSMDLTLDIALQSTFKGVIGSEAVEMIECLQNGMDAKDTTIEGLNSENAMLRAEISRQKVVMEQEVDLRKQLVVQLDAAKQEMAKEVERMEDGKERKDEAEDVIFGVREMNSVSMSLSKFSEDLERIQGLSSRQITGIGMVSDSNILDHKEREIREEMKDSMRTSERDRGFVDALKLEKEEIESDRDELIRWNKALQEKYDDLVRKYEGIDVLLGSDDIVEEEEKEEEQQLVTERKRVLQSGAVPLLMDDAGSEDDGQMVWDCKQCAVHCYAKRTGLKHKNRVMFIFKILVLVLSVFCALFVAHWLTMDLNVF